MVLPCLGCLEEAGLYSKKRIGIFLTLILAFGILVWLIVVSAMLGNIEKEGNSHGNIIKLSRDEIIFIL